MRPEWARPGKTDYIRLLLWQRQCTPFERVRRSLARQIVLERQLLVSEGVPLRLIHQLEASVGGRVCSGCGRPMPGSRLQLHV